VPATAICYKTAAARRRNIAALALGTFALVAGLMWGLIFVGPLLLPEYPAALQSVGRYLAFGPIALPLAWFDREALRELTRADLVWRSGSRSSVICCTTCVSPARSSAPEDLCQR
jgi:hypothetical protein